MFCGDVFEISRDSTVDSLYSTFCIQAAVSLIILGMAALTSLSHTLSYITFLFSEWRIETYILRQVLLAVRAERLNLAKSPAKNE